MARGDGKAIRGRTKPRSENQKPRYTSSGVRKMAIGGNPGDMATGGYGTGMSGVTGSVGRNTAAGGTGGGFGGGFGGGNREDGGDRGMGNRVSGGSLQGQMARLGPNAAESMTQAGMNSLRAQMIAGLMNELGTSGTASRGKIFTDRIPPAGKSFENRIPPTSKVYTDRIPTTSKVYTDQIPTTSKVFTDRIEPTMDFENEPIRIRAGVPGVKNPSPSAGELWAELQSPPKLTPDLMAEIRAQTQQNARNTPTGFRGTIGSQVEYNPAPESIYDYNAAMRYNTQAWTDSSPTGFRGTIGSQLGAIPQDAFSKPQRAVMPSQPRATPAAPSPAPAPRALPARPISKTPTPAALNRLNTINISPPAAGLQTPKMSTGPVPRGILSITPESAPVAPAATPSRVITPVAAPAPPAAKRSQAVMPAAPTAKRARAVMPAAPAATQSRVNFSAVSPGIGPSVRERGERLSEGPMRDKGERSRKAKKKPSRSMNDSASTALRNGGFIRGDGRSKLKTKGKMV